MSPARVYNGKLSCVLLPDAFQVWQPRECFSGKSCSWLCPSCCTETHCCVCTEAMLPMGLSQHTLNSVGVLASSSSGWQGPPLTGQFGSRTPCSPWWPFLKAHCSLRHFYLMFPSFPRSFLPGQALSIHLPVWQVPGRPQVPPHFLSQAFPILNSLSAHSFRCQILRAPGLPHPVCDVVGRDLL